MNETEWGVFRQNGDAFDRPMEGRTFASRSVAEKYMAGFNDYQDWLELRCREVTPWQVAS